MRSLTRAARWCKRHPFVSLFAGAEILLRLFFPGLRMFAYCKTTGEVPRWTDEDRELFYAGMSSGSLRLRTFLLDHSGDSPLVFNFGDSIAFGSISRNLPVGFASLSGYNLFLRDALQYKLALPRARVEFFGTGGYSTHQALVLMKRVCARVKPNLLIVCSATNDMAMASESHKKRLAHNNRWQTRLLHALYSSRAVGLLGRAVLALKPMPDLSEGHLVQQVPRGDYRENLEAMADYADELGVPLIFLSEPPLHEENDQALSDYGAIMAEVASRHHGVHFVDVRAPFAALRQRAGSAENRLPTLIGPSQTGPDPRDIEAAYAYYDPLFSDGLCHPSSLGYLLITDLLMEAIVAGHLLPFDVPYRGGDVLPLLRPAAPGNG